MGRQGCYLQCLTSSVVLLLDWDHSTEEEIKDLRLSQQVALFAALLPKTVLYVLPLLLKSFPPAWSSYFWVLFYNMFVSQCIQNALGPVFQTTSFLITKSPLLLLSLFFKTQTHALFYCPWLLGGVLKNQERASWGQRRAQCQHPAALIFLSTAVLPVPERPILPPFRLSVRFFQVITRLDRV